MRIGRWKDVILKICVIRPICVQKSLANGGVNCADDDEMIGENSK